jgi:hypothetical protein
MSILTTIRVPSCTTALVHFIDMIINNLLANFIAGHKMFALVPIRGRAGGIDAGYRTE